MSALYRKHLRSSRRVVEFWRRMRGRTVPARSSPVGILDKIASRRACVRCISLRYARLSCVLTHSSKRIHCRTRASVTALMEWRDASSACNTRNTASPSTRVWNGSPSSPAPLQQCSSRCSTECIARCGARGVLGSKTDFEPGNQTNRYVRFYSLVHMVSKSPPRMSCLASWSSSPPRMSSFSRARCSRRICSTRAR